MGVPPRLVKTVQVTVAGSRGRRIGLMVQHRLSNIIALSPHFLYSDVISQPYGHNSPSNPGRIHMIYDGPCSREWYKAHNGECRIP